MDAAILRAVLITGCSSGIGRAAALRLARNGWPVYATARHPEAIEDLADACTILPLDVTDEQSMQAAVATVERDAGAVGVLQAPADRPRRQGHPAGTSVWAIWATSSSVRWASAGSWLARQSPAAVTQLPGGYLPQATASWREAGMARPGAHQGRSYA